MTTPCNRRGPRWSSPKQADRGRPIRGFSLSAELHRALDALAARRVNLSALAEEALCAHPQVAAELGAIAPPSSIAKPAAVLLGQRWRCVGIEGELEVCEVRACIMPSFAADIGLRTLGATGPETVRAHELDMLGLPHWTFVGGPPLDHEAEQSAIVDRMARLLRERGPR